MNRLVSALCVLVWTLVCGGCQTDSSLVVVGSDDTVIDEAMASKAAGRRLVVRFGEGVVKDVNGDGVVHVRASNVVIECEGVLRGAGAGELPNALTGTGVRVQGQSNVTVRGLEATGFKVGLRATDADGLIVEGAKFDGLYRMRLKSTAEKEHNDDWLFPHENDKQEWVTAHGARRTVRRCASSGARACRYRTCGCGTGRTGSFWIA